MEDLYEMSDTPSQSRMYSVRSSSTKAIYPGTQNELSIPASAVKETLDLHIAQQIWHKAARLLAQKNAILPVPSRDTSVKAFSVLSEFGDAPNFVQIASSGKITCTCKNYKSKKTAHMV